MKAIVCEMCSSNDLVKQDGMYVCQNCGTKYTVEEAKKLMIDGVVDVKGTVTVDTSTELQNLYELARRAKADNNSEKAQDYYSQIIVKDPSSWEANFYTTYYQSVNCKIAEIGVAANRVKNCEDSVLRLIKKNIVAIEEQRKAVNEVATSLISISDMLCRAYESHYSNIAFSIRLNFLPERRANVAACRDIVYNGGNSIVDIFGEDFGDIAVSCWKLGVEQDRHFIDISDNKQQIEAQTTIRNEYIEKIKKHDNSYEPSQTIRSQKSGGCYVATAVYGSYDCPQVWTLRRYRDYTLAETWYGRAFIRTYYVISPTLVKWFGKTNWFIKLWQPKLDKMVERLNAEGVENTPYADRDW